MNRLVSELEFEKGLSEIRSALEKLTKADPRKVPDLAAQRARLEAQYDQQLAAIYREIIPWNRVLISRHPQRPRFLDFAAVLFPDFIELHGDRRYGDDGAIVGGPATFQGRSVILIGEQKGRSTKENIMRNFGMPHPEGYRKAERLIRMAERFDMPIVTFVDTSGASALEEDEARGVSWAIAECLRTQAEIHVPIISVIIGEGMSGGAIAIAMGNRVLMLEHSIYSVIAPEACASQLWRDVAAAPEAATAMHVTAQQLLRLGLIDRIVPEPLGGAHRDPTTAALYLETALREEFSRISFEQFDWAQQRYERYRQFGQVTDTLSTTQKAPTG
ncbi:MAG: acetyl-CoA carboxylase carboxyltransferase subunit alpha [Chloroflexi bacterium]|nr:acetyl-CoA carboxylase carboxyltransferase subunit alpha [Chloroflexota bacterium]